MFPSRFARKRISLESGLARRVRFRVTVNNLFRGGTFSRIRACTRACARMYIYERSGCLLSFSFLSALPTSSPLIRVGFYDFKKAAPAAVRPPPSYETHRSTRLQLLLGNEPALPPSFSALTRRLFPLFSSAPPPLTLSLAMRSCVQERDSACSFPKEL